MRTDIYTKIMLTIIAISLSIIALQNMNLFQKAHAEEGNFNKFASIPVNADGSINVKMPETLDINLARIGGSSVYNNVLPINLKEVNGSSISSGNLPVNIKEVGGSNIYDAIPVKNK